MTEAYAIKLAKLFHDNYERLAPNFGYETRKETKHFDTESANGRLMIATCQAIIDAGVIVSEKGEAEALPEVPLPDKTVYGPNRTFVGHFYTYARVKQFRDDCLAYLSRRQG